MARMIWPVRTLWAVAVVAAMPATSPSMAIEARPVDLVGFPSLLAPASCKLAMAQLGGSGPGAAIPFARLRLGAPVIRTSTSFTTGGGGTSNAMIAAQRRAAGLPYKPPTVDPNSAALPATFAVDRSFSMTQPPYQRLPLAPSPRIAEPYGLIFAQAVSPTRGRIASLALYIAGKPNAAPRYRLTVAGGAERGCIAHTIDIYAPGMSGAAVGKLLAPNGQCQWRTLTNCNTRADWPRGQVLFVSSMYGQMYEYRWIDYDLLADWRFAARP